MLSEREYPLLTSKLSAPRLQRQVVARPRLFEQLSQGLQSTLTLVSAPAGFGKTTLLSQWLTESQVPTAWLSLDAEENEPARFLAYLIAALQTLEPDIGQAALEAFSPPPPAQAMPLGTVVAGLLDALAKRSLGEQKGLVLDDYHVITTESIHAALRFLLDHCPQGVHIFLATRVDPPLSLARMRARGQLTEIRAHHLQFDTLETNEFLGTVLGQALPDEDIAVLQSRTEGWIAGLHLVALSLQGQADVGHFIADFTGSHRHIMDYLFEEVLSHLPQDVQAFLVRTSILDRLTGSLCDAVTASTESTAMLEHLERANLFLVPLDEQRQWYRYHQLFAEMLRARLQRGGERAEIAALYMRASDWYDRYGFPHEAVESALAGTHLDRAACLIEDLAPSMILSYQHYTLRRWLQRLPYALLLTKPVLCQAYAWTQVLSGQLDLDEALLQAAERTWQASGRSDKLGQILALRALAARLRGDASSAIDAGQRALHLVAEDDLLARSISISALSGGYQLMGNVAAAWQSLTEGQILAERAGNTSILLGNMIAQGDLLVMQGKLVQAFDSYTRVIHQAGERLGFTAEALLGQAHLCHEWNDLVAAEGQVQQAIISSKQLEDAGLRARGLLALARLTRSAGDLSRATELLDEALGQAKHSKNPDISVVVQAQQTRWWLSVGKSEQVRCWREASAFNQDAEPEYRHETAYLVLARVLMAEAKRAEALQLLERWLNHARQQGRTAV